MNYMYNTNKYRGYTALDVWAYGSLQLKQGTKFFISTPDESMYRVSRNSVGMYVGKALKLTGDNSCADADLYTGDIVVFKANRKSRVVERFAPEGIDEIKAIVKIERNCVIFSSALFFEDYVTGLDACDPDKEDDHFDCFVLGNIYENIDLLE